MSAESQEQKRILLERAVELFDASGGELLIDAINKRDSVEIRLHLPRPDLASSERVASAFNSVLAVIPTI